MIKDALTWFESLCRKSVSAEEVYSDREQTTYAVGGELKHQPHLPPLLDAIALDIETLSQYDDSTSEVWFDDKRISVIKKPCSIDTSQVRLDIHATSAWLFLCGSNAWQTQKEIIRSIMLFAKNELYAAQPELLDTLRRLKFATSDTTEGVVTAAKASLGRSVESSVTGTSELPETITVVLQRWVEFDFSAKVEIILDVDLEAHKFRFVPIDWSLADAEKELCENLINKIGELFDAPILHGVYRTS